jgi:hypothetical protein
MVQSSLGFQSQVQVQPVPGYEGDFASTNPRFSVLAGPGAAIAGANGVTVGRFAWAASVFPGGAIGPGSADGQDANGFPAIVSNTGSGQVTGFVHREQQGLITTFLQEAGMLIQPGYGVTLMSGGDFLIKNNGSTTAVVGNKCYASVINGAGSFAPTGATSTLTFSGSTGPATAQFTGSIVGNVLTVTVLTQGTITVGGSLTGGAAGMVPGTQITGQVSGATGGTGVYLVSIGDQNVASGTITETYGILTIGTLATGTVSVGMLVSGGSLSVGTTITAFISGTGGTGTYAVNITQTTTTFGGLAVALTVETKWIAMSVGNPGELVKISDHALG